MTPDTRSPQTSPRPIRHGFREKRIPAGIGQARVRVFRDAVVLDLRNHYRGQVQLNPHQAERLALALSEAGDRILEAKR